MSTLEFGPELVSNKPRRNTTSRAAEELRPGWKLSLHHLLESPTSSTEAFVVHVFTITLIVFSGLVTIVETIPAFHGSGARFWFGVETSLVVLFTVEYVARCLAWSGSWRMFWGWFSSFFSIVDLLAIVPYYVEIAIQADTASIFRFSIMRTFRLLRVFRPFRHNSKVVFTIEVMYLSFTRSKDALLALAFFIVMALVVFSTLIYFAERGEWDDSLGFFLDADGRPSKFDSIPSAAWFVLVTISTVGYGEITPRSFLGRLFTLPLLVFGLLLIALPSFVLGREFSNLWDSMGGSKGHIPRDPETPRRLVMAVPRVSDHSLELQNADRFRDALYSGRGDTTSEEMLERYRILTRELQETRVDIADLREEVRRLAETLQNR